MAGVNIGASLVLVIQIDACICKLIKLATTNEGNLDTGDRSDEDKEMAIYIDYQYSVKVQLVVANLTCQEAIKISPPMHVLAPTANAWHSTQQMVTARVIAINAGMDMMEKIGRASCRERV